MINSETKLEKVAFWVNVFAFILAAGIPLIFALWVQELEIALVGVIGFAALINIKLMRSNSKWAREFLLGAPLLASSIIALLLYEDGVSAALAGFISGYLLFFTPGFLAYLVYLKNEVPRIAFYKSPVLLLVGILLATTVGRDLVDKRYQNYLENQPLTYKKIDKSNNDSERWIAFEGGFYDPKIRDYIIPPQFEEVKAFSEGLAAVKINGNWGYINSDAGLVIPAKYDDYGSAEEFKNGRAIIHGSSKALLIDKNGETIASVEGFVDSSNTNHDLRILEGSTTVRTYVGYVDSTDFNVIETNYIEIKGFGSNGLAAVRTSDRSDRWGYVDDTGNLVIDEKFDRAGQFSAAGLALAVVGEKHGYIDEKGEFVLRPSFAYSDLRDFSDNGLAAFESRNGKWGFFDTNGSVVIKPKYDSVKKFSQEGFSVVVIDGKRGVIDSKGDVTIPLKFGKFEYISFYPKKGYAQVKDGYDVKGYIEKNGRWIVYKELMCEKFVIKSAVGEIVWPTSFSDNCDDESVIGSGEDHSAGLPKSSSSGSITGVNDFDEALNNVNYYAPREPLLIDSSTKRDYVSKGGVVIDRDNNLMWSRCAHGQSWNGQICSGEALEVTWEQAGEIAKSSALGNFNNWRLPTIKELQTLIYCSNGKRIQYDQNMSLDEEGIGCIIRKSRTLEDTPTIDISHFINHSGYGYWSSTTVPANAYSVLFDESEIVFMRGSTNLGGRKYTGNVRLVRSGHN